jgi:hypothetical protein
MIGIATSKRQMPIQNGSHRRTLMVAEAKAGPSKATTYDTELM